MKIKLPVRFPPSSSPTFGAKPRRGAWPRYQSIAFTCLELLAVLSALALLAVIALPVLAGNRLRSEQVTCLNNLRQIGLGFEIWGSDHGGSPPFRTQYWEGGLQNAPPAYPINNVFFQFLWISNELQTPKILACPSDPEARVASNWSRYPSGGLDSPHYQNWGVSYILGLDSFPDFPQQILSGDRNMMSNSFPSGCSSMINQTVKINLPVSPNLGWAPGLHGESGNILLHDGRVQEVSSAGLRRALSNIVPDYGDVHFLYPR